MDKKKTLKLALAFGAVAAFSGCAIGPVGVIDHNHVRSVHIDIVPIHVKPHYVSPHYVKPHRVKPHYVKPRHGRGH